MCVGVIWSPLEKNQSKFWAHLKMPKILIFVVQALSQQIISVEKISKPLEALLKSFGYHLIYSNWIMIQLWDTQSLDNCSRGKKTTSFHFWGIESSINLTGVLVGSWLFCIWYFPCLVGFRYMLGVGVEVWSNVELVLSFLYHLGIYNEEFILIGGYGYGYGFGVGFLTIFLFSMPVKSIYYARALISRWNILV